MEKKPNRLLHRLSNLLVPGHPSDPAESVSNKRILRELITCFETSLAQESVGTSLLFNAHYLIVLHPDTYAERLAALPVVVDEAVKAFYKILKDRKRPEDKLFPVSSHWYFKFGPGREFDGKPIGPGDIEVIGALSGLSLAGPGQADAPPDRIKATRKVKNTNMYERMDTNLRAFEHIDFRETGAFAVEIAPTLLTGEAATPAPRRTLSARPVAGGMSPGKTGHPSALARVDCYLADRNVEETYWMQDREVVVARREPDNETFLNYLRLDSPYVSNPHARIRYHEDSGTFQIASFSRHETRINEQIIPRSEPADPQWAPLPDRAQVLLNGVVTLSFYSNI